MPQLEALLQQFPAVVLLAPVGSKGFPIASDDVGATRRYVVYPGSETFAVDRRTTAIPPGAGRGVGMEAKIGRARDVESVRRVLGASR